MKLSNPSVLVPALALWLAGCGVAEDKFVETATTADCDYRLACYDAAALTFEGWNDNATCYPDALPYWEDLGSGTDCEYDSETAKACIDSLEAQAGACPDDPGTIPDVCSNVFTLCAPANVAG